MIRSTVLARILAPFAACVLFVSSVLADQPETTRVELTRTGDTWRFDVTVKHADTGWDHYADGWEILDADGNRLGYRKLHHPHVDEQPFTRSLTGVRLPAGTTAVFVRAHCNLHGWADQTFRVAVP